MRGPSFSERLVRGFRSQIVYGVYSLTDPFFFFLIALGLASWFVGRPVTKLSWDWLLIKAVVEELFFRFLLQESLDRLLSRRRLFGPISMANMLASLAFAAMHLFRQPLNGRCSPSFRRCSSAMLGNATEACCPHP